MDTASREEPASIAIPTKSRRWLRFSLRSLFVVLTVVIVSLGWYVNRCESQRRTVSAIKALDSGAVQYIQPRVLSWEEKWQTWLMERGVPQDYLQTVDIVALMGTKLDRNWFRKVEPIPSTTHMIVVGEKIDDEALRSIARWRGLRNLQLFATSVTDAGLVQLQPLSDLQYLTLEGSGITGDGLAKLSLPNLEGLDVAATEFSDAQIKVLERFPKLKTINIDKTRVTEAGRKKLAERGLAIESDPFFSNL